MLIGKKEKDKKEKMDTLIQNLGLSVKGNFVPFSQSRNKNEKTKNLNWEITLLKNNKVILTFDYMQGIAHIPNYKHESKTVYEKEYVDRVCEEGKYNGNRKLPEPNIKDILYCLVNDYDVINYSSFEDWARGLGFNEDSIKDKKIYDECMKTALVLLQHIGQEKMKELGEKFVDY